MPTTKVDYNFIKHQQSDKYPPRIDWLGLDRYFNHFRQTGLVTEAYINTLKDYFLYEDRMLKKMRPQHDLVKIAGMDTDFVFNTFEPDEILNHIDESYIAKFYVIYRKALIELHVSKYIDVVLP